MHGSGIPPRPEYADPFDRTVDRSGTVAVDLPCRKCGYNLRGLAQEGRCPECGTEIAVSMGGDLLRYSDPDWLEGMARGTRLILWALVVMIVGTVAIGVTQDLLVNAIVAFIAQAMWIWGGWLLTEPDPSGIGEDRYGTARKLIRIALIIGLGEVFVDLTVESVTLAPTVTVILQALSLVASIIALAGQLLLLYYLHKLALRIPDDQLAGRAKQLLYAYGISMGAMMVLSAILLALMPVGATGPMMALACIMIPIAIVIIVVGVMWLFLIYRMGTAFRHQAELARAHWSR